MVATAGVQSNATEPEESFEELALAAYKASANYIYISKLLEDANKELVEPHKLKIGTESGDSNEKY